MNMSLFKIFKYLLKYKEISIWDSEIFYQVFCFLSMLSLNSINTPALNNLKKEANKSLCILANKCTHSIPELDEMIEKTIKSSNDLIVNKTTELSTMEDSTIAQAFSMIKGYAIKGSPKSYQAIQFIIDNLKNTSDYIRVAIVKHWHIIFSSHDFIKSNKFNISPFYKQRLFSVAFPALIKAYREAQISLQSGREESVPFGLISKMLIPICSESAYELYKDYMSELLPLIIYSLNLDDEHIKSISLHMIKKLLQEDNNHGLNTEELLLNLIKSLSGKMSTPTKNLTLICMSLILETATVGVLKHRKLLVSKVKKFLDDRKRSTRRLAVKCINDWSIA